MRLLITGGCGFIGVNLVHRLLHTGHQILILDNQSAGNLKHLQDACPEVGAGLAPAPAGGTHKGCPYDPRNGEPGTWFISGDIRERRLINESMPGVEAVIHLAAHTRVIDSIERPEYDMEVNVQGTLNLLEAARAHAVKRFIFASSGATLGEQPPPIDEQNVPRPISPYGASKLAGEGYCSAYFRSFGLETVALRFSNVYGPRSFHKGSVIAHYMKQLLSGKPLVIYGDGEQTRDFLYVDDLCEAICSCLRPTLNGIAGEAFQIATEQETSINAVASMIQNLGRQCGVEVNILHGPARQGEVYRNYAKIAKAQRLLEYGPKTDLKQGIAATWEWFRVNWRRNS